MKEKPRDADFRNRHPSEIDLLFKKHGFSDQKIRNFRHAFRQQQVAELRDLRGIRGLDRLMHALPFEPLDLIDSIVDPAGNRKFVFKTRDDLLIESVLMPEKKNISLCISVQAGCRFGCRFCQTGKLGFVRNMLPHEMLEQIRLIYLTSIYPRRLGCVTFMGMGEPFDNIENCRTAFDWIRSDWGWSVGSKKITFSTTGAVGWKGFFAFSPLPNLAVSLHAATEEKRTRLMPRNSMSLAELKKQMIRYTKLTNKQVSIQYCLLRGVNDSPEDADELAAYLRGIPCKINFLNYNPVEGVPFQPVGPDHLLHFKSRLSAAGFPVLHRKSLGVSIGAGCGQLGSSMKNALRPTSERAR
jgi:23S rRNA (adenine2503-C2)-methyltransferase